MESGDQSFRRPRNWNVLHALESLSPPSPSPSGSLDVLASLASSGEIPIFLHTDPEQDRRSSIMSVLTSPRSRPASSSFLKPSSSMATFHSTNTFGMPRPRSQVRNMTVDPPMPDDISERTERPSSLCAPSPDPSHRSARRKRNGEYWSNRFSTISDFNPPTIPDCMDAGETRSEIETPVPSSPGFTRASPSVPYSICASDSIVISPADDDSRAPYPPQAALKAFQFPPPRLTKCDTATGQLVDIPSHSWSTISSALFAPTRSASPSPSISTAISEDFNVVPTIRYRSPLLRNTYTRPSSAPYCADISEDTHSSQQPLVSKPYNSPPTSPGLDTFLPPRFCPLDSGSGSGSGSGHTRSQKRTQPIPDLPEILGWLQDSCIELWIDQEGFRAIRPKFRLVGYTASSSPDRTSTAGNELVDALTYGIAVFLPVKRETCAYHHGTLDSTPVLRRLTLADNEDKDYISRQASLTIKSNGVYVVTGTELFDDHPFSPASLVHVAGNILNLGSQDAGPLQLQWRFEYVVDDRKSDSGRPIPGEKAFTPLSFSCSPGLLHPSHGKRIHLMYVLMKNLVPKISAHRTAPHQSISPYRPEQFEEARFSDRGGYAPPSRHAVACRSLPGTTHRRTQSSEPSWSPHIAEPESIHSRARPRSLSGAGLEHTQDIIPTCPHPGQYPSGYHASRTTPGRQSRQILTREELAVILASFPTPGVHEVRPRTASGSPAVRPLSPPSYYRHRRTESFSRDRVNEMGLVLS